MYEPDHPISKSPQSFVFDATFFIRLPLLSPSIFHPFYAMKPLKTFTVLIVDDSELLQTRLANMLRDIAGVELIGQARSAMEASRLLKEITPDAVILDIRMPGGSGIDLIAGIKKLPRPPVVIVLTAFSYNELRNKCAALNADYFFDKTKEFECVSDILRSLRDKQASSI